MNHIIVLIFINIIYYLHRKMKIVHINAFDSGGGAAIACVKHCEAMIQAGHEVTILVLAKSSRFSFVKKVHQGIKKIMIDLWDIQTAKFLNSIDPIGTYSLMNHGFDFSKDFNLTAKDEDVDTYFEIMNYFSEVLEENNGTHTEL